MTEGRKDGTTEGHGESSIAPLFQSGAIIIIVNLHTRMFALGSMGKTITSC